MLFFARVIESVDRADAGSWQIADGGGHAEREGSSTRATILRDPLCRRFWTLWRVILSRFSKHVCSRLDAAPAPRLIPLRSSTQNATTRYEYDMKTRSQTKGSASGQDASWTGHNSNSQSRQSVNLSLISVSATPPRGFRCLGPSQVRGLLFRATRRTHFRARTAPSTWR